MLGKLFCSIAKALKGCELDIPTLNLIDTIDINEMSSILLDKLEEMGDTSAQIYLADYNCDIFDKEEVKAFLKLDETNKIKYIADTMDCDDFAAELYGKGLPLVWTNLHALNWFIGTDKVLYFVEPQTDQIATDLDNWQGWSIRLFINR